VSIWADTYQIIDSEGDEGDIGTNGNVEADVVCALPTSFRYTNPLTPSSCNTITGVIQFNYTWDSTSGNKSDLSACTVREVVTYPNGGVPPSPPFPSSPPGFANPTIIPPGGTSTRNGTSAGFLDTHSPNSGSFVKPYSETTYTATQTYQYNCSCQNTTDFTPFSGFSGIAIQRAVTNPSGTWIYQITKAGQSCAMNLPQ
jgi:hypothetical protein